MRVGKSLGAWKKLREGISKGCREPWQCTGILHVGLVQVMQETKYRWVKSGERLNIPLFCGNISLAGFPYSFHKVKDTPCLIPEDIYSLFSFETLHSLLF